MKTAIYIEDGIVQLVLTPESDFEKNALASFSTQPINAQLFTGSFYDCRGGWVRQKEYYPPLSYTESHEKDHSLIIRTSSKKEADK